MLYYIFVPKQSIVNKLIFTIDSNISTDIIIIFKNTYIE